MNLSVTTKTIMVMKLTMLCLLVFCLQLTAKTYSQTAVTISEKNVSLKTVLKEIERQTGYTYILSPEVEEKIHPVTVDVKNATIEVLLDQFFAGQAFTYKIIRKTIIVKRREANTATVGATPEETGVPTSDIKGKVQNERGEPVAGASVFIRGTNKGTTTEDDGSFKLRNVAMDADIAISSLGYFDTTVSRDH